MDFDILGPVQHVIGSRYVESVKPYVLELTGESHVAGPFDAASDASPARWIGIEIDGLGRITTLTLHPSA